MATLAEVSGDHYLELPQIARSDVKILWSVGYWDGPLDGILLYKAKQYWFEMCQDYDDDAKIDYRRYVLVELTAEQLATEAYWHNLFMEKVADHSDENGHVGAGVKPRTSWDEFYGPAKARTPRDFSANTVIGWFER